MPAGDVADLGNIFLGGLIDGFHGGVHLGNHVGVHTGRPEQVVADTEVAVLEALLLDGLVVVGQLFGVTRNGHAVGGDGADDLELACGLIFNAVADTDNTDVNKAAGKVGETVRLAAHFNRVELDAEGAGELAKEEGVGASGGHADVELAGMGLGVFHEAREIVIRGAGGNGEGGIAVILHGGDEGEVIDGVDVAVASDVLDVQRASSQGNGGAVGLCVFHGLMADGVGVIVGDRGLETVEVGQGLSIIADREVGAAAGFAGDNQGDGFLLGEADVIREGRGSHNGSHQAEDSDEAEHFAHCFHVSFSFCYF